MAPAAEPRRLTNARTFLVGSTQPRIDEAVAAVLSPEVVYDVPGRHRLAGQYHGRAAVMEHAAALAEFSRGTFEVLQWIDWMVGEKHISALQYAQAQHGGRIYRGHHLYLVETDADDLISGIKVFFEDQAAGERFFA